MKITTVSKRILYSVLALGIAQIGCSLLNLTSVNSIREDSQSVKLGTATSANVRIDFPAGELKVQSGTKDLMDASFRYNFDDWQPEVSYSENGTQGELLVSTQANNRVPVGGQLINEWLIQLSDQVPVDLQIRTGAGDSQLDLGGLDMTSLSVETGAGVTTISLNGTWAHDLDVSIQGGVGQLTVNLPAEMGVRVDMDTALVSVTTNGLTRDEHGYVNQAYGTAPHTLTLDLQAGVGSVVLAAP
jgi:hypothetical protein